MEKWSIQPAPTSFDPLRHLLLVKGSMKDVSALLRRFGALCGRPSSENTPEGFNYSLPLHGVTTAAMERLSAALNEMSGVQGGGLALRSLPPASAAAGPAAEPAVSKPEPDEPAPVPFPAVEASAEPEPEPAPELVSLAKAEEPNAPAELGAPIEAESAPAARAPVEEPAAQISIPVEAKPAWDLLAPFDALQTFDTLLVGPYNRFAHAAATSVVSAPGSMYNPLFLYGAPGTGKTHFLHSIGRGLGAGGGEIVMTSGARLSNGVTKALSDDRFGELKDFLGRAKGLIVDDVHLVAVTDQNKAALAEIFSMFFSNSLQVVLSSIYPPRALGGLEEALKFSLAKGWAVDLKLPNPSVQVDIIHAWLDQHNCHLSAEEVRAFHERLGPNYSEALVWMRRLATMNGMPQFGGKDPNDLLSVLFDPGVAASELPSAEELERTKDFAPPPPASDALPLAIIVPKGHELMAGWVASAFHQAARQFSIKRSYRHVLLQAYDASQPFGVPFQIGEACRRAQAEAALVIGPPNDTNLAGRMAEFYHAVTHVLHGLDISCGWLHHRGTMAGSPFLRAHLDFLYK